MPRRNHRSRPKSAQPTALEVERAPRTTEEMARSLVVRGLASPLVCDGPQGHRSHHDASSSRQRHPSDAVAPVAGNEGRERGTRFPAQTGLRDDDSNSPEDR